MKSRKSIRWISIISIFMAFVSVFVPSYPAFASSFALSLAVNNTTGTGYTNVPFIANTSNDFLIGSGKMLPTGLDTRVYNSSGVALPHMLADNNTLFVGDAPAHISSMFTFKGGETVLPSMDIIPGYSGNVSTIDDATIELGHDFIVEIAGKIDTSIANKYLIRKNNAFLLYVSNAGELSANVTMDSGNVTVTAAGVTSGVHDIKVTSDGIALRIYIDDVLSDTTNMVSGSANFTVATHGSWAPNPQATYILAHDSTTPFAGVSHVGQTRNGGLYQIWRSWVYWDTSTIPDNASVLSANMTLNMANKYITGGNPNFDIVLLDGSSFSDNSDDYAIMHNLTSPLDEAHTADLADGDNITYVLADANLGLISKTGTTKFGIRSSLDISATAPAEGQEEIVFDTTTHTLRIVYGQSMADNGNDWIFMADNVMSYADNISFTVNGVNTLLYKPNNIIHGNTLPDRSGYGNDGVITWGSSTLAVTTPALITLPATNIAISSATLNGQLIDMAGAASYSIYFDYGTTTSYGQTTSPIIMGAPQLFSANASGLVPNTEYHFRAVGVSTNITLYGGDLTFTTLAGEGGGNFQFGDGNARVFKSYLVTNDLLFTAEIVNTYTPYYPSQSPKEYFTVQLIDTDNTTILAATPQRQWGDKPIAIYLNPTQAAGITYGAGYYIRVQANFADNISVQYQLRHGLLPWNNDWKGSDLTRLDDWCISVATNMQAYYKGAGYVTVLTDRELAITDAIGGYFTIGIPAIGTVRPNLFTTSQQKPVFNLGTINNTWDNATAWSASVGPSIAADAAVFAVPFGMTGRDMLAAFVALGMLGVVMTGAATTGGFGALGFFLISVPILWLGTYFKIVGVQYVIVLTIIFGILFIRQFWVKTT